MQAHQKPSREGEPPEPRPVPATRVTVVTGGPVLVEGPVEIVLEDGSIARSDRFLVALCACRRSVEPRRLSQPRWTAGSLAPVRSNLDRSRSGMR
ncbi:CDGSH iron-sulfur domain-containing protein [Nonomuraea sp. NPDC050547]|uniref:CDGSH iron-sulfur domain-containing protein n=1 Tax=Nonomuraea sp. NPDC050547 TaxID=3364368 RepID=UPI0037B26A89